MNRKIHAGIRWASLTVGGLLVIALLAVAGVLHFVLTPEKLTPVVLKVANQALDADLKLKKVELTFFSTFPQFGLRVEEGTLVSKASRVSKVSSVDSLRQQADSLLKRTDSLSQPTVSLSQQAYSLSQPMALLPQPTDSLLAFRECVLTVNPLDFLLKNKVTVHNLTLVGAQVYAFRDSLGRANWDIVRASADSTQVMPADTTDTAPWQGEIDIRQVALRQANLVFDDRSTDVYTRIEEANLQLRLSLTSGVSSLGVELDNRNLLFWQQGQLLVNHLATALRADVEVDRATAYWTLKQTELTVNGIRLDVQGTMQRDTTAVREVDLDLRYGLHAPSMETVLNLIPEHLVKRGQVKADGQVRLDGTVKGRYGQGKLPAVALRLQIQDAQAQYAGMPYGIDALSADFEAYVDLMRREPSFLDLKIFRFQGAHTDVLATLKVEDLLSDPLIRLHTKSTVDLDALAQTFPWQEGVSLHGRLDAGLDAQCRWSALKRQDYGRLSLTGQLALKEFELKDVSKDFTFYGNADFHFSGKEQLEAELEIRKLLLRSRRLSSDIERMKARVASEPLQDTTRVVPMQAEVELNRLRASSSDSLAVYSGRTRATARLSPNPQHPLLPVIGLTLRTDSLYLRAHAHQLALQTAGFDLQAEKVRDSLWIPRGIIGFDRLWMRTSSLALPVRMQQTAVTVDGPRLSLKNASLQIGRSDLVATGDVWGLYRAMTHRERLKARLALSSQLLDCNELIQALSVPSDTLSASTTVDSLSLAASFSAAEEAQSLPADSVSEGLKLFILPQGVDFEGQADIRKVLFEQMVFDDLHGRVDLKRGTLHLRDLRMRAMEADMQAVMVYRADSVRGGYTGFDFKIKDINVAKLVDFIPSMDSIVPMLRSFKGRVQFDVAAEAHLDSAMNIRIPTLRSAMHIQGDSLVLMDGETFAEISKMLMFKNKKRNVFDSISVNVVVNDGSVIVYPFQVTLDRYRAAIGGKQGLDMHFDYHISILKSPLPFKAGINITGTPEQMKFRLGKAKYKDDVTPAAIHKVDSTRLDLGRRIVERFQHFAAGGRREPR